MRLTWGIATLLWSLQIFGCHGILPEGLNSLEREKLRNMINTMKEENEFQVGYSPAPRDPEYGHSSKPEDVRFYIYSDPNNYTHFEELKYEHKTSIRDQNSRGLIDITVQWKFLIHGFTQNQNSSFPELLVKEYLKHWRTTGHRMNIVVVDWGRLAGNIGWTSAFPVYSKAVANVQVAGKRVGQMIKFLKRVELPDHERVYESPIMNISKVHLIGFSLGAHVAGVAGAYVSSKLSSKVGRITGIDPAGPYFYDGIANPGRKLSKDDARSVDIIHGNWNGFGIAEDIGDIDFYPNAGLWPGMQIQPWCDKQYYAWQRVSKAGCSHNLAPVYFALSINHSDRLKAYQCGSWASYISGICPRTHSATMGEHWNPSSGAVGPYYLVISSGDMDNSTNDLSNTFRRRTSTNRIRN